MRSGVPGWLKHWGRDASFLQNAVNHMDAVDGAIGGGAVSAKAVWLADEVSAAEHWCWLGWRLQVPVSSGASAPRSQQHQ